MRVFKYTGNDVLDARVTLMMSLGKIVHAEIEALTSNRGQEITLWAEVNAPEVRGFRSFQIFGTGHPIPDGSKHLLTQRDGMFVWHLYEVPPK